MNVSVDFLCFYPFQYQECGEDSNLFGFYVDNIMDNIIVLFILLP